MNEFHDVGFSIIPSLLSSEEVAALRAAAVPLTSLPENCLVAP